MEELRALPSLYPEKSIRILQQTNQGVSAARNNGIRESKYPFFIPLDADNVLDPEAVTRAITFLKDHPEYHAVYGDERIFGEIDGYSLVSQVDAYSILEHHRLDTCALIRKEVWEKTGGYAEDMPFITLEDWVFWIRATSKGFRFFKQPGRFFFYRHRKSSKLRRMHAQAHIRLAITEYLWREKSKALEVLHQQGILNGEQAGKLRNEWSRAAFYYACKARNWMAIRHWVGHFVQALDTHAFFQIFRRLRKSYPAFPASAAGFPDNMSPAEKDFLQREFFKSSTYLEFGAGESTRIALQTPELKQIRTVESDPVFMATFLQQNKALVSQERFHHQIPDLGPVREWGIPTDRRYRARWPSYVKAGWEGNFQPDLILVDGRFRVACSLEALLRQQNDFRLLIHDFPFRPQYHLLLDFFHIENAVDRLYLLKPRADADSFQAARLLKIYQYLPEDKSLIFKVKNRIPTIFSNYMKRIFPSPES